MPPTINPHFPPARPPAGMPNEHDFKLLDNPVPDVVADASSSFDPEVATADDTIAARETATVGIKQIYSPMVDVSHEPRWGRIAEGGGEDPYLGSVFAAARVKAAQGSDYSAPDKVVLIVEVVEKSTGSLNLTAGYSTSDGVIGGISVTERNLLGRGQNSSTDTQLTWVRQTVDFGFNQPSFSACP